MGWAVWAARCRLLLVTVICLTLLTTALTVATDSSSTIPAWATPTAKTLRLVGPATDLPNQPNYQSNLDCTELTYRVVNTSAMQAGCFMPTAYGMVDPDSDEVIFNGSDEALSLVPYSAHQVLTPWPQSVNTLTLDALNTGGAYVGLYKNITAHLQDQRDLLAKLTAKRVIAPPDIQLADQAGRALVINPQTMAFSDGGSWLVVETLTGSFVRINLATLTMTAFAPAFGSQGSPALLKSQVAVSPDGRYVAIENGAAASFKVYDLANCTSSVPSVCAAYDYWSFIGVQVYALDHITHLRFVNDGVLGFVASQPKGTNQYLLAPSEGITSLIDYLALGDSYTSGEGAFDYLAGTDTGDDVCHLSVHSYPLLLTAALYTAGGGHSVACSGARSQDILPSHPDGYPGQVRNGVPQSSRSIDSSARILADFTPGYLAQANFVRQYLPGVVSLSVGGDDIGFGDMIQNCVEPHISLHLSDSTCYDTYEDRLELKKLIDRTVAHWTALYTQLQAKSPMSRIYVIGYPQIVSDTTNCGLNVHLSKSELEFAEEVVSYLNGALQQAATGAGVNYVDISQALSGHRLCEATGYAVAVNGLTAGTDGGLFGLNVFGKESYHPNALGQSLIAAAILRQTNNLRDTTAAPADSGNLSQTLLNAPSSGRSVNTVVPEHGVANSIFKRGESGVIKLDGVNDGLIVGSTYIVRLDGPSGSGVGAAAMDADGTASGSITIPPGTAIGGHTIDITGQAQSGESVDITQPIYVTTGTQDSDGDGLNDTVDSCPTAINSGVDADGDGIDDSCDGTIGPAAVNKGAPGNTSSGPASGNSSSGSGNQTSSSGSGGQTGTTSSGSQQGSSTAITLGTPGSRIDNISLHAAAAGLVATYDASSGRLTATQASVSLLTSQDHQNGLKNSAADSAHPSIMVPRQPTTRVMFEAPRKIPLIISWLLWIGGVGCWLFLALLLAWLAGHWRERSAGSHFRHTRDELLNIKSVSF